MKMTLLECPRCKKEWSQKDHTTLLDCSSCNLSYYNTNQKHGMDCVSLYFIETQDCLTWELDDDKLYCTYSNKISYDLGIRLPWLPFDISYARIKLLIVMS